jgi:YD repeat-containing protein
MTVRVVGGITYTLTYDRENRLTGVTGPSSSATFLYDAAGNRVLEPRTAVTVDGETSAYIGGVYEHTDTGASTSTYAGSLIRRVGT